MGKAVVIAMLLVAFGMGAGLWYAQTRGYYDPIEGPVTLTLASDSGLSTLPATDVQAIASSSSPLGFRACFGHALSFDELADELAITPNPDAAPTIAPGWFDCFDAEAIGGLLASGEAQAYLAYPNVAYGVDRVVALTADGRGWSWHELNECGHKAYDGTAVGPACPDRATYTPLTEGSL